MASQMKENTACSVTAHPAEELRLLKMQGQSPDLLDTHEFDWTIYSHNRTPKGSQISQNSQPKVTC